MTDLLPLVFVTLFGLAIGSFLNVCIYRLPRGESLAFPASHCPACGAPIAWYHNVPVIGYALLGGRCASCRGPISPVYPLVELTTAALFALHYLVIGPESLLIPRLLFAAALVALFMIDLEHQILPNVITLPGIAAGFLFALWLPPGWRSSLAGIALGGGLLWAVAWGYYAWRRVEGLGMGDVKMLAMVGAFLGWQLTLLTLFLSSLAGAGLGMALVASGRGSMKLKLPFGTFIALGALVASLVGQPLVDWYGALYH
jgi:leader peptidase (prepilin peptidase)/N-methyltransferase